MKRFALVLALLALIAAACTAAEPPTTTSPVDTTGVISGATDATVTGVVGKNPPNQGRIEANPASLRPFAGCDVLLDYVQTRALDLVTPWGLEGGFYPLRDMLFAEGAAFDDAATEAATSQLRASVDYSTTNVQEQGVDEPDLVKTDGERLVTIVNNQLHVVDVTGTEPKLLGTLLIEDSWSQELLLSGNTVVLLGQATGSPVASEVGVSIAEDFAPYYYSPTSTYTQVDISDPTSPRVVRTMWVDGAYLSARMIGSTARIVIDSFPTGLEFSFPEGSGLLSERKALQANRDVIRRSTIENWIPYYLIENADGTTSEGLLLDCEAVHRPAEFSGLGTLVVITLDLERGLSARNSVGVYADGQTIYAATDGLYVATQRWIDWRPFSEAPDRTPPQMATQIHKFDISDPAVTVYRGTGEVSGYLLNQFAMSEWNGDLRVASTTAPEWAWWGTGDDSESLVTILGDNDGELVQVGRVDGLGKGERIFAVRMFEDIGYVVTFRQTDPLYTLDLTNPENPRVLGELKINGYSAYLHPIGEGRVLGVGQDATDEGRVLGTQVSLFDVSNLENPDRIAQYTVGKGSNSSVEFDHRAFLYWPAAQLGVIPLTTWSWDERTETEDYFTGALALSIGSNSIEDLGRITHDDRLDYGATILRSVVIGDKLLTISQTGLKVSDIDTLADMAWLAW